LTLRERATAGEDRRGVLELAAFGDCVRHHE